ncbi:MAG: hypothetical protein IIB10_13100 [Chloroflexi bacterium]|nr:hypothetical protein [Chloroflexota bacterium]
MQKQRLMVRTALVTMAFFATSCAVDQSVDGTVGEPIESYDGLLDALRENGSTVESVGPISQPFFVPEGQLISVDGNEIQVFEFSTPQDAQSSAESISPDGSSVGTSMIMWVEAPHFYRSGKLIVLYVGEETTVVDALEVVLGAQIAGR